MVAGRGGDCLPLVSGAAGAEPLVAANPPWVPWALSLNSVLLGSVRAVTVAQLMGQPRTSWDLGADMGFLLLLLEVHSSGDDSAAGCGTAPPF